jgi:hypothetical protein
MKVGSQKTKINALLNLLEDDDSHVSALAMEQLLLLDNGADDVVREFQESPSPVLRSRIHQLDNLLTLRRRRRSFIARAKGSDLSLLEGLSLINYQYNPKISVETVRRSFESICEKAPVFTSSTQLAAYLHKDGFALNAENYLASELYLLDEILEHRQGAPVMLCCIAKCLADHCNWPVSVILYKGRHCLIDKNRNLIETWDSWRVTKLPAGDQVCHCSKSDLWLSILGQLFLASLQEGQIQAVYRVSSILAEFCGGTFDALPFPLGQPTAGESS